MVKLVVNCHHLAGVCALAGHEFLMLDVGGEVGPLLRGKAALKLGDEQGFHCGARKATLGMDLHVDEGDEGGALRGHIDQMGLDEALDGLVHWGARDI